MTLLQNVVAEPKLLAARLRVGQAEPVALKRSVQKLGAQTDARAISIEDVGALQQRIAGMAASGSLSKITRRDLREGCKVILQPPHVPASDPGLLDGVLGEVTRNKRRAAFFALIDAYLDGFDGDNQTLLALAHRLSTAAQQWPWRQSDQWAERIREFSLLEPARAPEALALRILAGDADPRAVLDEAGLNTPGRRFGGLAQAAFRFACHVVMGRTGQEAVNGQRILIAWAEDDTKKFGYQRAWPDFVKASLIPWEIFEPSEAHKAALIDMLERFGGGDPRANPQRWRTVMDTAPGAYAVLMRWLTRASVLQFLDIVDRLMPDAAAKRMWAYRRAFWMSYLLSDGSTPGIDAAWVAFGDDGARLARQAARDSGDKSFSAFGKQNDKSAQHAALILKMGDLTIVDWSHSAKYQVWKRGDNGSPELFQATYRTGALYRAPIQESHLSPQTYNWQKRLASIIEGRQYFTAKHAWKP